MLDSYKCDQETNELFLCDDWDRRFIQSTRFVGITSMSVHANVTRRVAVKRSGVETAVLMPMMSPMSFSDERTNSSQ